MLRVGDPAEFMSVTLSPDHLWIATQQGYPAGRTWIYNPQTGAGRRLTSLRGSEMPPVRSPDSHAVYFAYQDEAGWQVMRQFIESGSAPEPLLAKPTDVGWLDRLRVHRLNCTPFSTTGVYDRPNVSSRGRSPHLCRNQPLGASPAHPDLHLGAGTAAQLGGARNLRTACDRRPPSPSPREHSTRSSWTPTAMQSLISITVYSVGRRGSGAP